MTLKPEQSPIPFPLDVHFETETGDPDDLCTLLMLLAHPAYRLRSVNVTPGTDEQVGMIRHVLAACGAAHIPVGSASPGHDKRCVGAFYHHWLGAFATTPPDMQGADLLQASLRQWPALTLLSGAPLKGLARIAGGLALTRWVAQGGFAGDSVVPEPHRLEKFAGRETCATYNFNGAPEVAERMLANPHIQQRWLVSKNVCHGMIYDEDFHARMQGMRGRHAAWDLLLSGMDHYLAKHPGGKKFHDPLAAAVAARPGICSFREVRAYRRRGEWGSVLEEGTGTWITVAADRTALLDFLTEG